MPLVMLITVLKPLSVETHHAPTCLLHHRLVPPRVLRANPMAPISATFRDSVLLGFGPQWGLLGAAPVGIGAYLVGGYVMFKRLEVNFADLT